MRVATDTASGHVLRRDVASMRERTHRLGGEGRDGLALLWIFFYCLLPGKRD